MSIYLMDLTSFDFANPAFIFDCELEEQKRIEVEWTEYPIEMGAVVSDYGSVKPKIFTVRGICTATPLDLSIPDPIRLSSISDKLEELAEARQPMTLVTATWVRDVVIESVSELRNVDTGEALEIEVTLRTIFQPVPQVVDIPAELLRADLKAGGTPDPNGGAAAGVDAGDGADTFLGLDPNSSLLAQALL